MDLISIDIFISSTVSMLAVSVSSMSIVAGTLLDISIIPCIGVGGGKNSLITAPRLLTEPCRRLVGALRIPPVGDSIPAKRAEAFLRIKPDEDTDDIKFRTIDFLATTEPPDVTEAINLLPAALRISAEEDIAPATLLRTLLAFIPEELIVPEIVLCAATAGVTNPLEDM